MKTHQNSDGTECANIAKSATVAETAYISPRATVGDRATVGYGATVGDGATFNGQWVKENVVECLHASLPLRVVDGKITLYKRVNKTEDPLVFQALHDNQFKYRVGDIIEAGNPDPDWDASCASGLHFSTPNYWANGDALLLCEIEVKDILAVLDGKVRASKCKVLCEVSL